MDFVILVLLSKHISINSNEFLYVKFAKTESAMQIKFSFKVLKNYTLMLFLVDGD